MTLDYGNYGIFLVMGDAGYITSTVLQALVLCGPGCTPVAGPPAKTPLPRSAGHRRGTRL